ncbi:hypothetical protein HUE46_03320 [Flavobacterium columnare]|uniref:hypothetical protein n=1 Tax=Flavobacterium columnare TaxID=996 RepID=UPI00177B2058|nr:hypothetical protein [Flavobacterium columnare]QOG89111.1 hypothetical protein HUE41_03320 [Flavobacterium columnare]QOG91770.1 hypothetical protein HUE42_03315 [Flavobacterium columnare]QOG94434.1 hypothetical protein HUE43_03320 [Flavobacterium columnare]QOG97093.1 hypothetical protein HUE44_03315 [Flavobacterium columnare]QOG99751.1 hypothetical protein HUE45_03315 [Flavobacterium columnare]
MGKTTIVKGNVFLTTGGNFKVHSKENIENHSQQQVIQKGVDKGVTHNKPKSATLTDLKIIKVEGPFDENDKLMDKIGFEKFYTYKATPSRKPTEAEVKLLKWATKNDDEKIKELGGVASNNQLSKDGKIIINIAINNECEKARVYAFYKKASDSISVNVTMLEPLIIFVCGYWNKDMPYAGDQWNEKYWGKSLREVSKKYFKTEIEFFLNGAGNWHSQGGTRWKNGEKFATDRYKNQKSKFFKEVFKDKRKIMIVSHSMGGAFAEGMISFLVKKGVKVSKVVHLSPADTSQFSVTLPDKTYQIDITWDPVLSYKNLDDSQIIRGMKYYGLIQNPKHDEFGHMYTKQETFVWNAFEDLEKIELLFNRSETKYERLPSDGLGPVTTIKMEVKIYDTKKIIHNTVFEKLKKNGKYYFFDKKIKKYYTQNQ